jgi:dihydroflavonol-4-reductase
MAARRWGNVHALVTGATGFLGTNLVHELVSQGWRVRAFGLPGSSDDWIRDLDVEIVFGDVTRPADVQAAVHGVDVVFNVAGDTSWWRRRRERQRRVNIEGPVVVAEAAASAGVHRIVQTSTADVFGVLDAGERTPRDETATYNLGDTGYRYGDTKLEGDRRLQAFGDRLEIVWIHPGAMLGPYDFTLQYGRLFADLRDGRVPACPSGGTSWAHVREVARAHVTAVEKGEPGTSYLCAGVNATYREVFTRMATLVGATPPRREVPQWALTTYGHLLQAWAEVRRRPPQIDPGYARFISRHGAYDSSRAVRALGYDIPELEQMIGDAYAWYVTHGLV